MECCVTAHEVGDTMRKAERTGYVRIHLSIVSRGSTCSVNKVRGMDSTRTCTCMIRLLTAFLVSKHCINQRSTIENYSDSGVSLEAFTTSSIHNSLLMISNGKQI